ncbi:MAG: OmpP1/FadL family transporter [Fusobacteriaceae bacterium]
MKRLSILAFLVTSSIIKAASIDHIMNYTPEYNANPALQGAINTSSTVNYNPAGLTRIEDGLYINGGLQFATGEYSTEFEGEQFKTDLSSGIPNFSLVKKDGRQAFFWTVGGIAGGAGVEYKDGISKYATTQDGIRDNGFKGLPGISSTASGVLNILTDTDNVNINGKAKGENYYIQTTLGTAYQLDSKWSVSGALRLVHGQRNFKGDFTVDGITSKLNPLEEILNGTASADAEREAWGFGGQVGINYAATDKLNIGMRYDTKVRMNFETKANNSTTIGGGKLGKTELPSLGFESFYPEYADGFKARRDLPAILALGASYSVTDRWMTFVGGNYYFNKAANIGERAQTPTGGSRKYKDGYELSLGSEYQINDKWSWLAGINYAVTGATEDNYHDSEYALDSIVLGTGAKYRYSENLMLTASVSHFFYDTAKANDITYKKQTTALGAGFTYKWN